ncbi:MAG: SPOR domain-containing protein [Pseudomonadota bacterium]
MAKKRQTRKKKSAPLPGWVWMVAGLAIGSSIMYGVNRYRSASAPAVKPTTVAVVQPKAEKPPAASIAADEKAVVGSEADKKQQFDFYDELPRFELIVPEVDIDVDRSEPAKPIEKPGIYEIQAGSFAQFADADRRRAELALLGVESRVQPVTIDTKTYHRVRIGPIDNTEQLNRLRAQLAEASIETATIRIGG